MLFACHFILVHRFLIPIIGQVPLDMPEPVLTKILEVGERCVVQLLVISYGLSFSCLRVLHRSAFFQDLEHFLLFSLH